MALQKIDVYLDNDFDVEIGPLARKNLTTGVDGVATGLVFRSFISSSQLHTATPVHADLDLTLAERGSLGIYYGTFEGPDMSEHLAAFVGQVYFRHVVNSAIDYHTVLALKIRDPRPASTEEE